MSNETELPEPSDPDPRRSGRSPPWGQERRLEFIEFKLQWEGKINRSELGEFFNISIQQASLDFARYMVLAEENMEYDRREKVYRAAPGFKPKFLPPQSETYLNQLADLTIGTLAPAASFIGIRPPCSVVQLPSRRVRSETLQSVLGAIRDQSELEITYQSMRRPSATRRWIAPHALAFDGSRWHARAWCHESSSFRDFVLTRIQEIHGTRRTTINPAADGEWHTHAVVVIEPRPDLTVAQRDSVITDYGMIDGKLRQTIRRALVQYFIRQLHLDSDSSAASQPIVWANRSELADLVDASRIY
jgi:hypothetical protein